MMDTFLTCISRREVQMVGRESTITNSGTPNSKGETQYCQSMVTSNIASEEEHRSWGEEA